MEINDCHAVWFFVIIAMINDAFLWQSGQGGPMFEFVTYFCV